MSHRDRALEAPDPYKYCIANHISRSKPWGESHVTFYFEDGSELTFDIRYEVRHG